jgi:phosphopantetheinyl transferase (holo-ACP synthase)
MNGSSATGSSAAVVVQVPSSGALRDLLGGTSWADVYSPAEARRCSARPGLSGWAGRLAAKRAVAQLLGHVDRFADIEILPDPRGCPDPACTRPHPPALRLAPALTAGLRPDEQMRVSISHTRQLAVALAVVAGRPSFQP